ncbi:MAG: hypothetical protein ACRDJX_10725 [Solirubrobacteraceae bacterium]
MSALGAAVLAIAAVLPWYRVSSLLHAAGSRSQAPRSLTALSSHQALPDMRILLLVLAGLAMLDALLPLLRTHGPVPGGAGGSVALLGIVAALCALYRIVDPPAPASEAAALSLLVGPWLALLGALAMLSGGVWPSRVGSGSRSEAAARGAWPGVQG